MTWGSLSMLCGLVLAAALPEAELFDARVNQARENEKTPEWGPYSGPFFESLGPILQRTMQRCFPQSQEAATGSFTILFEIQANGALANLMVRPESAETACALDGIRDARVPEPPRPGWWTLLEMKVTP